MESFITNISQKNLDFISRLFCPRIKYILFIKVDPKNVPAILLSYDVASRKSRTAQSFKTVLPGHPVFWLFTKESCVWGLKFNLMNKPTFSYLFGR